MSSQLIQSSIKVGLLFAILGMVGGSLLDFLFFEGPSLRSVMVGGLAAFTLGFVENFYRNYGSDQ